MKHISCLVVSMLLVACASTTDESGSAAEPSNSPNENEQRFDGYSFGQEIAMIIPSQNDSVTVDTFTMQNFPHAQDKLYDDLRTQAAPVVIQSAQAAPTTHQSTGDLIYVPNQPVDYRETIKFIDAKKIINLNAPRIPLNGLYTRVLLENNLTSSECNPKEGCTSKILNYKKRNFLSRFFSSTRVALSASANVNVQAYSASIPLLTITEISSSEVGESWERTKVYTKGDEPLFLVPPSSTSGSLVLSFKGSEDKTLNSSKALDVAIGTVGILSPQSQLLTSLNKKSIMDKSKAIDNAISKSFSEALSESIVIELVLDSWNNKDKYQLTMNLPQDKTDWEADIGSMAKVGIWTLRLDAPRVSAFYPVFICNNDKSNLIKANCEVSYEDARDAVYKEFLRNGDYFRVLDAPLYQINDTEKISVATIISELSSVKRLNDTSYISALDNLDDREKFADVTQACSDIARKASELGLSAVDSSLIIYSTFMASSMVKIPSSLWQQRLPQLSSCKLAVSEIVN